MKRGTTSQRITLRYSLSGTFSSQNMPHPAWHSCERLEVPVPPTDLDKKLAQFLRKQRGEMSYVEFAKKTGLTSSSLFRLENGMQSITLTRLHGLLKRLKANLTEIFPP